MKVLTCLVTLLVSHAAAQTTVRLYERGAETVVAAFPEAGRAGSLLHELMERLKQEMPRSPIGSNNPIILAVRAAAELQRERPEAAPNAQEVLERCLGIVDKEYGPLNATSAFAKAFWEYVPEVRAQLPDFNISGAWPLAAGALAGLRQMNGTSEAKSSSKAGPDFGVHQNWLAISGAAEWPPKHQTLRPVPMPIVQTSPDTWQLSDGTTITRNSSGHYELGR